MGANAPDDSASPVILSTAVAISGHAGSVVNPASAPANAAVSDGTAGDQGDPVLANDGSTPDVSTSNLDGGEPAPALSASVSNSAAAVLPASAPDTNNLAQIVATTIPDATPPAQDPGPLDSLAGAPAPDGIAVSQVDDPSTQFSAALDQSSPESSPDAAASGVDSGGTAVAIGATSDGSSGPAQNASVTEPLAAIVPNDTAAAVQGDSTSAPAGSVGNQTAGGLTGTTAFPTSPADTIAVVQDGSASASAGSADDQTGGAPVVTVASDGSSGQTQDTTGADPLAGGTAPDSNTSPVNAVTAVQDNSASVPAGNAVAQTADALSPSTGSGASVTQGAVGSPSAAVGTSISDSGVPVVSPSSEDDGASGQADGSGPNIEPQTIGLDSPMGPFISLVEALLTSPDPQIAAGDNGTASTPPQLFWTYSQSSGLQVDALPGFLTTSNGDGGFILNVLPDGSWALKFDGSEIVIGYDADDSPTPAPHPPPPDGNTILHVMTNGASVINATAGNLTVNGNGSEAVPVIGYDTIAGGLGDYMIGGSGTGGGGLGGNGNCAIYTASPRSVLVDMQNGYGYGGNAEGNVLVNMNQVRGSLFSNVLIGSTSGTDLKSGGDNSLLISTGGNGFELRPDGSGNVLVSTVGADRIVFDPTHGWALGDDNILLGFNPAHGDVLDLSRIGSTFNFPAAPGANVAPITTDISNYVQLVEASDGEHLLFSPTGNVQNAGIEILDMMQVHGLTVAGLYQSHNLLL